MGVYPKLSKSALFEYRKDVWYEIEDGILHLLISATSTLSLIGRRFLPAGEGASYVVMFAHLCVHTIYFVTRSEASIEPG